MAGIDSWLGGLIDIISTIALGDSVSRYNDVLGISEILSSLDDKIDLLTRQNATLEALAQAYFREWFVEGAR